MCQGLRGDKDCYRRSRDDEVQSLDFSVQRF